jgi:AraC-like DNA-binding protein
MFEIASRAGFSDARLFNNVCRRIYGKTPGQLRREAQV